MKTPDRSCRYIGDMEITEERKEFVRSSDPETGKYTLTVKDVQKETAGKYVVQFSNDLGNAKSSANLKVMCKSTTCWKLLHWI